jgi:hypothetical protein
MDRERERERGIERKEEKRAECCGLQPSRKARDPDVYSEVGGMPGPRVNLF